ncbi:tyrosine-type recombinase/integrase [Pseudoxanthomonas mexicana]
MSDRTRRAIGRTALRFLAFVGELYGDDNFVGKSGRIAVVETSSRRNPKWGSRLISNYSHRALPKASTRNRRDPITDAELAQLRDAAVTTSPDPFVRKRRLVMLRLLEITGARRGEAAKLSVGAVQAAARSSCPVLLVSTLKQDVPNSSREIPISGLDANFLNDFSEQVRSRRLRKIGLRSDPDQPLLVNARTGRGLRENTITQEVRDLGIAAGISRKISPHLFRHRYITARMSALIEHLKTSFPDEFHKGLIDPDSLKHKVAELSGHRSVQSLDVYLHLSLERLYGVTDADVTIRATDAIESFILQVHALQAALECDDSKERKSASSDLFKLASDFLSVVKEKP